VSPGILRAFDANDVSKELWNNRQNISRDIGGSYAKFSAPTIANGHVYLPTFSGRVVVYGLQ
jgi:outer membrane protein assembly factor BamB